MPTLGLDEYAQKYGEAYTNMNAYWRYYEEEQMVNGVQVKRPELILLGQANSGYKRASGGLSYQQTVSDSRFFIGGIAGSFESGFDLGVRSLEKINIVTGRAANGAYITRSRNSVSLANKSAYLKTTHTANALKIGGRIVGGGVVAYNGLNLLANGGCGRIILDQNSYNVLAGWSLQEFSKKL